VSGSERPNQSTLSELYSTVVVILVGDFDGAGNVDTVTAIGKVSKPPLLLAA